VNWTPLNRVDPQTEEHHIRKEYLATLKSASSAKHVHEDGKDEKHVHVHEDGKDEKHVHVHEDGKDEKHVHEEEEDDEEDEATSKRKSIWLTRSRLSLLYAQMKQTSSLPKIRVLEKIRRLKVGFKMNSFINTLVRNISGIKLEKSTAIFFSDEDCLTCMDPCQDHKQIPESMAKRIDQSTLYNTFKPYKTHILVGEGSPKEWPEAIENGNDTWAEAFSKALEPLSKKGERIMLTCFAVDQESSKTRVLIFPQGVELLLESKQEVQKVCEWIAGDSSQPSPFLSEPIDSKALVLVCSHTKRDKKCGVAGPLLIEEFGSRLQKGNLLETVPVLSVSHYGGHKFAGNCIIYFKDIRNVWVADWYGRVKTCHVDALVRDAVLEGKVIKDHWRGRMNADPSDEVLLKW
jgi:hypothetical protein